MKLSHFYISGESIYLYNRAATVQNADTLPCLPNAISSLSRLDHETRQTAGSVNPNLNVKKNILTRARRLGQRATAKSHPIPFTFPPTSPSP